MNTACQHMHKPKLSHVQALKTDLALCSWYNYSQSLLYKRVTTYIQGYSDADWAGDMSDPKSTSGYCVYIW